VLQPAANVDEEQFHMETGAAPEAIFERGFGVVRTRTF